jgi:hypothetical protein
LTLILCFRNLFLQGIKTLGIKLSFEPLDLIENKNMTRVLDTLAELQNKFAGANASPKSSATPTTPSDSKKTTTTTTTSGTEGYSSPQEPEEKKGEEEEEESGYGGPPVNTVQQIVQKWTPNQKSSVRF